MMQCPVCDKALAGEVKCPRCCANLIHVQHIIRDVERLQHQAFFAIRHGELLRAEGYLTEANQKKQNPLYVAVLGFINDVLG